MSNLLNKAKDAIHQATAPKGSHHTSTVPGGAHHTTGTTTGTHPHTTTTGTHPHTATTGAPGHSTVGHSNVQSSNHGPHSSNLMNKVDPRVDSDRDGSRTAPGGGDPSYGAPAGAHTGTHSGVTGGTHSGLTGGAHTGPTHTTTHTGANTTHGPHDSNLANKLDPRVDSDRDGSRTAPGGGDPSYGAPGVGHTGAHSGVTGGTHTGAHSGLTGGTHTGSSHTGGVYAGTNDPLTHPRNTDPHYNDSTNHGPHKSNLANKLDPRVDSDRDGSRTAPGGGDPSYGAPGVGHTGAHTGTHTGAHTGVSTGTHTGAAGPHNSSMMNRADPRIDSDLDGSRTAPGGGHNVASHGGHGVGTTHGTTTHGTHGTTGAYGAGAPGTTHTTQHSTTNTAGPHKSDMMNKLDPRVDSDLDGSKTVGGNATYR